MHLGHARTSRQDNGRFHREKLARFFRGFSRSGVSKGKRCFPQRRCYANYLPRETGALEVSPDSWGLLHWDGEFASIEELVKSTLTGRNFGWLPDEKALAVRHFASVISDDPETLALMRDIDPAAVTDEQMLEAGARVVGAYLKLPRSRRCWPSTAE